MDGNEIAKKVLETYASFDSYEDHGVIREPSSYSPTEGWFRTWFMKPDQLLFQWDTYAEGEDKTTLMIKGGRAQLLNSERVHDLRRNSKVLMDLEKVHDSRIPLSLTGGTTFGMSDSVLPLLVTKPDRPLWPNKRVGRLRDEEIDGEPCFQLREIYRPIRYWISQNDFTVRRCEGEGVLEVNMVERALMNSVVFLANLRPTFKKEFEKVFKKLDAPSVWTYKTVKFNHLTKETFPKFEFKNVQMIVVALMVALGTSACRPPSINMAVMEKVGTRCPETTNRIEKLGRCAPIADPFGALQRERLKLKPEETAYVYRADLKMQPVRSEYSFVILDKVDEDAFLELSGLEPVNYDISNADVRKKFASWKRDYGAVLQGANCEALWLRFKDVNASNVDQLAKEICEFCPDIEGQGETREEVKARLLNYRQCDFWWD